MLNIQELININAIFSKIVDLIEKVFFVSIGDFPLIIAWLLFGGLFLTLRMKLINIWGFKHALAVASGRYRDEGDELEGEVSPLQALATALSGSVGLGNIAGVAIAIQLGGAGAVFWMSLAAILGMSNKFVECSLGLKYRLINPDGTVKGGPMYYLSQGLAELGLVKLGRVLAVTFAFFAVPSALGGGNMFQANQAFAILAATIPSIANYDWVFGSLLALAVGLVIVGGISRIAIVTSRLVPLMVLVYLVACGWVLAVEAGAIPRAITAIGEGAFTPTAVEGGLVGVLVQGIRRSAFSNNAGLGIAAIAHAASQGKEPIREGIVSILEPFIDTLIVCNLTGLVIITTGMYGQGASGEINGSQLAARAFAAAIPWFPYLLTVIILLFAFSTMVTWSYYGEQCWIYLFGQETILIFKAIFLVCILIGAVVNLGPVVNFSDMMLLATGIPNLLGCILLSGSVAGDLKRYFQQLPSS